MIQGLYIHYSSVWDFISMGERLKHFFFLLVFLASLPAFAQPMTIRFTIGSELATTLTGATDEQIETNDGPYYYKDVRRLTFQMNLPDSATLQKLEAHGLELYLRSKRISAFVVRRAPVRPKSEVSGGDTTRMQSTSTQSAREPEPSTASFGLGLGLDYGGIGTRLTMWSNSTISAFAGVGYNLDGLGFNGGLDINFTPREKTSVFLCAMYGYNAVVEVPSYNGVTTVRETKAYYGPSFGIGLKERGRSTNNRFSFMIIFPVRDPEATKSADFITPVTLSVGYHFQK